MPGFFIRARRPQANEIGLLHRVCQRCHRWNPVKDYGKRRVETVFGPVQLTSPRIVSGPCEPPWFLETPYSPLVGLLRERATPELPLSYSCCRRRCALGCPTARRRTSYASSCLCSAKMPSVEVPQSIGSGRGQDAPLWHHMGMVNLARIAGRLIEDAFRWVILLFRSTEDVRAENLFLRRQLALIRERGVQPRRVDAATRVSLAVLAKLFDWRSALVVVQPATPIRWHRAGWKLLWRVKSRPGRPPIPRDLRMLIRRMADENPLWGEERIANELLLKLS